MTVPAERLPPFAGAPATKTSAHPQEGGADLETSAGELVFQHLNARGYVPFHPALAQHLGHKAALFMGLCLYWTRHVARNSPQRAGWVHLSARQIEEATTLSRREQDTVRGMLAGAGLLDQYLAGRPAVMHFRINLRHLANRLEIVDGATATVETAWTWFEKSVSYYRPLGDLAGSAGGGLYLSFVLRKHRRALVSAQGPSGHIQIRPEEVERLLCLTPKIQRTIRDRLQQLGLVTIDPGPKAGGILVYINLHAVLACIRGQCIQPLPASKHRDDGATPRRQGLARPSSSAGPSATASGGALIQQHELMLDGRDPSPVDPVAAPVPAFLMVRALVLGDQVAGTAQLPAMAETMCPHPAPGTDAGDGVARRAQTAKLEGEAQRPKRQTAGSQTAKLGVPKAPNYLQTGSTNTTTNAGRAIAPNGQVSADGRRAFSEPHPGSDGPNAWLDGLVFPRGLAPSALPGIHDVLAQAPTHLRQPLLDELQGQLQIPAKTIHNPAGWLLGLIRRCGDGASLALAQQVAVDRNQREAVRRQLHAVQRTPCAAPALDPQELSASRLKLQALRGEFARKVGRR